MTDTDEVDVDEVRENLPDDLGERATELKRRSKTRDLTDVEKKIIHEDIKDIREFVDAMQPLASSFINMMSEIISGLQNELEPIRLTTDKEPDNESDELADGWDWTDTTWTDEVKKLEFTHLNEDYTGTMYWHEPEIGWIVVLTEDVTNDSGERIYGMLEKSHTFETYQDAREYAVELTEHYT